MTGGAGGAGGQGENATGGNAGVEDLTIGLFISAAGGGLYNNSLDITHPVGSLTLTGDALAINTVTGGAGGVAGSGTTSQRRLRRGRRLRRRHPGRRPL